MKKFTIIILIIISLVSCQDETNFAHIKANKILLNKSDPYRHKKALDTLNKNTEREERVKYFAEREKIFNDIVTDHDQVEKSIFLEKYGKTKVAFVENSGKLYIMNLDGTEKVQITKSFFNSEKLFIKNIRWSPNGKLLVFNSSNDNSSIIIVNIETKEINQITDNVTDSWPNWSPDSQNVIFFREHGNKIITYDINSKKEKVLFQDWEFPPICPFYLPNGKDIAFNRNLELQVLRYGEQEPETLLKRGTVTNKMTLLSTFSTGTFEYGVISNTGKYFVVSGESPMIYNFDGDFITKTNGMYASWSHDDEYIMYNGTKNGKWGYWATPIKQDKNKLSINIFLGYGKDAVWSPLSN